LKLEATPVRIQSAWLPAPEGKRAGTAAGRGGSRRHFATQQSTTVAAGLGAVTCGMSATSDGQTIFFSCVDASIDELIVVEDCR
jgi:hypothetical protein